MTHNLLTEPLIQSDAGWHSLPGLMAAMARGEVAAFPALRPHQRPAWHMFLVQLATLALDAAGLRDLPEGESEWATALRALTPGDDGDASWHLVVEDRAKPAFLQPPDPGGLKWSEVPTPDALDMLITSRNHDLKARIAQRAAPQDWVFALVSVQTMEGYQLKYAGVLRMRSGASSRVMLTLAPCRANTWAPDSSAWWRRDTLRLLSGRESAGTGKKLLWVADWPDSTQLPFEELDPLFIEVCRRVRLCDRGKKLRAEMTPALQARINDPDLKGNTGDPWAPVKAVEAEALTLADGEFSYRLLSKLLFGERGSLVWKRPELLMPDNHEKRQPMLIVAEAFARGKGGKSRTDGFRSRIIPVPKNVVMELFEERAIDLAEALIKDIAYIDSALRNGLSLVAAEGDYKKLDKIRKSSGARRKLEALIAQPLTAFDRYADHHFFSALWAQMQAQTDDARAQARLEFIRQLAHAAEEEFHRALPAIPCARIMRPRAELRGYRALRGGLRRIVKNIDAGEELHASETA